jgi:hypothetical protein
VNTNRNIYKYKAIKNNMGLKTRLFGKKLKEDELTALMDVLKIDKSILNTQGEKLSTFKSWGRCLITPNKENLDVDLYIFRKDGHRLEGEDFKKIEFNTIFDSGKKVGDYIYKISEGNYKEKIPYDKIKMGRRK